MRKVLSIFSNKPTLEGAGVKLKRVFGHSELSKFDPFLLFDHFGSSDPEDYTTVLNDPQMSRLNIFSYFFQDSFS